MAHSRLIRVNELIRRVLADALYRIIPTTEVDLASVTITHVFMSRDIQKARVLVSVRGTPAVQQRVLSLLQAHRAELQSAIHGQVVLKYTPRLTFELDTSIAEGDRVLQLLSELEPTIPDEPLDEAPDLPS